MFALLDPIARQRLRTHWRAYLFATALCMLTLFITSLVLSLSQQIVIASLGASAFVVFAMPKSRAARTANTMGGHGIGLLCGSLATLIPHAGEVMTAAIYSLAVGGSCLLMLITRFKHPPAAGTALGIAVAGINVAAVATVFASAALISILRIVTLNVLQDFSADD